MTPEPTNLARGSSVGPWTLAERLYKAPGRETWRATADGEADAVLRVATDGDGAQLTREAALVAEIAHASVVGVREVSTDTDPPFLVVEWPEGQQLRAWIRSRPLGTAESLTVARALSGLLAHIHARGVYRPDLRPSVVVLTDNGPVVTDWGRSYRAGPAGQLGDEPPHLQDLAALGALLYALLTTERGDPGEGLDPGEGFAEPVRALVRELTGPPAGRPVTAREVSYRIRGLLNDPTVLGNPPVKIEYTPRRSMMRGARLRKPAPAGPLATLQRGPSDLMLGGLLLGSAGMIGLGVAAAWFLWTLLSAA